MRLALVVAIATLLGAAALSPATALPNGTYRYVMRVGGSQVGTSTVVITRSGNEIDIDESAALVVGRSTTSRRILDARTFLTRSYHARSDGRQFDISIAGTEAKLTVAGSTEEIATPHDAPFVVNDNMAAGFATVPIAVLASGARAITLACRCTAFVAVPVVITAAGIGTLTISLDNQTGTMRYDPATGVLQQFDLPGQSFSLALESHDASTAPPHAPIAPTPLPLMPEHYTSRDVTITADDGVKLAATLTLPSSKPPFAALLLVHGSGCIDRDETIGPNKIFAQIANHLSNARYAVLRYDKRSCGKSGGTFAVRDRLIADARDALAFLRAQPQVDRTRIYVLGHSEGGELAPSIAIADRHLRGIVLLAPPALPLEQILMQQFLRNVAVSRRAEVRATEQRALAAIESGKRNNAEDRWLRSSFGIDPVKLIANVPCPILILQGTKDVQVLASDTPRLVRAARAARRDVTVVMLEGDDHLFIKLPTNESSTGLEYFVPSYLDPALFSTIEAWLASH